MKIVFMGTPKFGVRILESLAKKYEVLLVVTQPDKPVGRKHKLQSTPIKECAQSLGIEVFQPQKIRKDYQKIIDANADVLVTAAYGQIVPHVVLESFKYTINVHASLLPKYRGGAPIQRSIINGDKKTGVSIMQMVDKMDAGVVYAKEELEILDSDNNEILFEKLSVVGNRLLLNTIEDIYNGSNKGVAQDESMVLYAPNLAPEEEKICFNKNSRTIFNQIRGLAMEPGAYFICNGSKVKVYASKILDYNGTETPGTIVNLKKSLDIKTLDGAISLLLVKAEGKKLMDVKSFLNGQKILSVGDICE